MLVSLSARALALSIDCLAGFVLGVVLAPTPLGYFFSERAVVLLRIGEPETWFTGPVAMMIGILGQLIFLLPLTLAVAFVSEAVTGAALGKRLCRLRVTTPNMVGAGARLFRRFLLKTSPPWIVVVALLVGWWWFVPVAGAAAVLLFAGWLVGSTGGRSSTPLDRWCGTQVIRTVTR